MSRSADLATAYHAYRQSTDHDRLIWEGDLDQIEHWEDHDPVAVQGRIETLRDFADRADALGGESASDRATLDTIAFTARSAANQLRWRAVIANSPLSRGIAEGEIDRHIGMPGQALSYMIGRLEIDRIRAEAEQRPGFDIKAFHDSVLGDGMVPVETLRRLVLG